MKVVFERLLSLKFRKRRRYRAKAGLFAIPENRLGKNQIGDISLGGLSFYYIDNGSKPQKKDYLLTVVPEDQEGPVQVFCKNVSDSVAGELISQNRKIKRRSVRFERLSPQQKQKLRHLIRDYTESVS